MTALLLSRKVKAELDEIWAYIATDSNNPETADRVVDAITGAFFQLSKHPHLGRVPHFSRVLCARSGRLDQGQR